MFDVFVDYGWICFILVFFFYYFLCVVVLCVFEFFGDGECMDFMLVVCCFFECEDDEICVVVMCVLSGVMSEDELYCEL